MLYAHPTTEFVADFVGLTNRLPGAVADGHAAVLGGRVPLLAGSATSGNVVVLVRPEGIDIAADPAGQATVVSGSFLGAHGRVTTALADGRHVVVQVPSSAVARYQPGTTVRLTPRGRRRPRRGSGQPLPLGHRWRADLNRPPAAGAHRYSVAVNDTAVPDLNDPATDPFEVARAAAAVIAERTGADHHDVALVLGSGWGQTGDLIGETLATIDNADVPGFAKAAVEGHSGTMRSVAIGDTGRRALVYGTRTHFYEGRGVRAVVHAVRTAAAAGCTTIVLTNGCGGLNPAWRPGTPVLIRDHINLTAHSPIEGANFVDLTDLYSPRLRAARQGDRRRARRGRLRAVPRPALRDAGRGADGQGHRRRPRRACRRRSRPSLPGRRAWRCSASPS